MKKHLKKILLGTLTFVFLATSLLPTIGASGASADPSSPTNIYSKSPQEQLSLFEWSVALVQCAYKSGLSGDINDTSYIKDNGTTNDVDNYVWLGGGGNGDSAVDIGFNYDIIPKADHATDSGYAHQVRCYNTPDWVKDLAQALGYSNAAQALCDFGSGVKGWSFYRAGGGSCTTGSGNLYFTQGIDKNGQPTVYGSNQLIGQSFENVLESKLGLPKGSLENGYAPPDTNTLTNDVNGPAAYLMYFELFTATDGDYSCKAQPEPGGASGNLAYQSINYIDPSTNKMVTSDFMSQGGATPSTMVYLQSGQAQGEYYKGVKGMSCSQVASIVSQSAVAFANYAKAHPNTPAPGIGAGGGGGSTTQTCDSGGGFLSWIMCDVLNGLNEAVNYMYSNLIAPLLTVPPLTTSNNGGIELKHAWSSLRIFGDIFLVIALLIIVFGESIGGGLIDAYTAKKALPRVLIAAVLVNLSFYIAALAVDVFNVLGAGIRELLSAGFGLGAHPNFGNIDLSGSHLGATGGVAIAGLVAYVFAHGGAAAAVSSAFEFLLFGVLLPAVLAFFAIIATLILRLGILYLLIAVSPVAFACWCLPNTEQYFKKWWDTFVKTLMMYPLMSALFAISAILAHSTLWSTLSEGGSAVGTLAGIIAPIMSLVMLVLPLALIPFTFKMAGGLIGKIHEAIDGQRIKGHEKIQEKLKGENGFRGRWGRTRAKNLADRQADRRDRANAMGGVRGRLYRGYSMALGGRYSHESQAAQNAESDKRISELGANGNDRLVRASTLDTKALKGTARHRVGDDGQNEYQGATGQWFKESEIDEAKKVIKTRGDQQAAFKYMLGKTMNEAPEHQEWIAQDFENYANAEHLDAGAASGSWSGISIPNQRMRADLRYGSLKESPDGKLHYTKNSDAHLDSMGTETGFSLASQQEGNFEAMTESFQAQLDAYDTQEAIIRGPASTPAQIAAAQAKQRTIGNRLANSYGNLEKFVGDGRTGRPAIVDDQGNPVPGAGGYGGASSASWKTEQAARAAKESIDHMLNGLGYSPWLGYRASGGSSPLTTREPYSGGNNSRADRN